MVPFATIDCPNRSCLRLADVTQRVRSEDMGAAALQRRNIITKRHWNSFLSLSLTQRHDCIRSKVKAGHFMNLKCKINFFLNTAKVCLLKMTSHSFWTSSSTVSSSMLLQRWIKTGCETCWTQHSETLPWPKGTIKVFCKTVESCLITKIRPVESSVRECVHWSWSLLCRDSPQQDVALYRLGSPFSRKAPCQRRSWVSKQCHSHLSCCYPEQFWTQSCQYWSQRGQCRRWPAQTLFHCQDRSCRPCWSWWMVCPPSLTMRWAYQTRQSVSQCQITMLRQSLFLQHEHKQEETLANGLPFM